MRLPLLTLLLLLSAAPLRAQDTPLFNTDFPPDEFAARRAKLFDAIGPEAIAVVQGAPAPRGYVRFRQTNEFYYLTGVEVPHAYLLLNGAARTATLYLPHRNAGRERSEGKLLSAEDADTIRQVLGFDQVAGPEALAEQLARLARGRSRVLYTPFSPAEGLSESRDLALRTVADAASDPWDGRPSREGHFIHLLKTRFPAFDVRDLTPALDALRLLKSDRELAMIRRASRLSGLALMEAMRSTVPAIQEKELDAVARYVFFRNGAQGDAYYSLIAHGTNAYYPHYNAGEGTLRAGELLLMDYAPDYGYYMSDLTRQWPVDGRWSPWQRELYGFYLAAYKAILANIAPGRTAAEIKGAAAAEMDRALAAATFTKPTHRKAAEAFVASYREGANRPDASLGHWVGMATHDVGSHSGPLQPGMVFTIEPALRVPEEQLYIRLEDLIIIHEDGIEVVSDFVPMEMDAIERLIAEPGMLQQYPKDTFEFTTVR